MANEALRYNDNKLWLSIVPTSISRYIAAVMEFGAKKYAKHNWRRGFEWTSILNSLERHLTAWKDGEDHDPESGLHHLAHVATNVSFLIEHIEQGLGIDDRYKLASIGLKHLRAGNAAEAAPVTK
jgi:Domain of unknown function (DUF5664)